MARSTTRSNQRPDTLTQDRICQVDETSCNARPDHTFGSIATELNSPRHVRFTPVSNRTADIAAGPVRATTGPKKTKSYPNEKIVFQSFFMLITVQFFFMPRRTALG
jgi:hypothetical protein